MTLPSSLPAEYVPWAALGVGALGILALVVRPESRRSPPALLLLFGFVALTAGAGLSMRPERELVEWGTVAALGGATAVAVAGVLFGGFSSAIVQSTRVSRSRSEGDRREVDRLAGLNVRLEDELTEAKARITRHEHDLREHRTADAAELRRRHDALEQVRAGEQRLRALLGGAREGLARLAKETLHFEVVNPALCEITGRPASELADICILDLLEPGPQTPGRADLQRIAREGTVIVVEILVPDGRRVVCDVGVRVVGEGADAGLVLSLREAPDVAETEAEIAEYREALERTDEVLREVRSRAHEYERTLVETQADLERARALASAGSGRMVEELRGPVESLARFTEVLGRRDAADPEFRREIVELIGEECVRLRAALARQDGGHQDGGEHGRQRGGGEIHARTCDLRDVIQAIVSQCEPDLAARGAMLAGAWASQPHPVAADRVGVTRVVEMLLRSALRAAPAGIALAVDVTHVSRDVILEVALPGAPPERSVAAPSDDGLVFERFVDDAAPNAVDPGIATCREIAAAIGTTLTVQRGGGELAYRLVLPAVSSPVGVPHVAESSAPAFFEPSPLGRGSVGRAGRALGAALPPLQRG